MLSFRDNTWYTRKWDKVIVSKLYIDRNYNFNLAGEVLKNWESNSRKKSEGKTVTFQILKRNLKICMQLYRAAYIYDVNSLAKTGIQIWVAEQIAIKCYCAMREKDQAIAHILSAH